MVNCGSAHAPRLRHIRLLRYRALHVRLFLVVVDFQVGGQSTDDSVIDFLVLLERVPFAVKHAQRLEVLQLLHEVDDLLLGEIDPIILERHLHDVEYVFRSV